MTACTVRYEAWRNKSLLPRVVVFLAVLISAQHGPAAAPDESDPFESVAKEIVEQTGPDAYRIGGIRIDAATRAIRFPAKVNMNEGLIEVIACTERGKLHESVLVSPVKPMHLHVALLVLGLEPGRNPGWHVPDDPAMRVPTMNRPPGDRVEVFVSWETPAGTREERAEALLKDERTGKSLPRMNWVFVGSRVDRRGTYEADEFGSLVTNYHDLSTVIDNPLEAGRIDDFTYANTAVIPPVKTPVEVRISPAKKKEEEKDG